MKAVGQGFLYMALSACVIAAVSFGFIAHSQDQHRAAAQAAAAISREKMEQHLKEQDGKLDRLIRDIEGAK